mmetsp:Transcript_30790/g.74485  ORF Transcript_30790/g.74485 Transcript_30790/m.74485 type:complete len:219 (-) Transcript_30790:397-1053(-)|eukprot:CAMPEP_0113443906 /NCGR_PEP_ID=MMETSP0014_2-20120614/2390_1 /TAXON_ID=2857 /ORGANISM="Nitzschia sp." /LENGTH=218 /DNA_ID=CAMNT_0000334897 /DNA_START=87 /DNA_END=743 /DNA_ORIENTATION=- /assembly_acc=CAM_ASM_000159
MSTLRCNCGKTSIKLATTAPRTKTVCCCEDCFDRFNVLHTHYEGPKAHSPDLPALFCTFDNSLVVESGDVMFFKATPLEQPSPINMASTCCHTYLMGYFEMYHHNCVAVNSPEREGSGVTIDGACCSDIGYNFMSFRHGRTQFDDLLERQPQFKNVSEFWFKGKGFEDGFDGTSNWEETLADVTTKLSQPIEQQPGGKTFDELLDERGGTKSIVILAK